MASKRQAGQQADGKQAGGWEPPRGIRYSYDDTRPNAPFYLHWRDEKGVRKAKGYPDEKAREIAAKDLADKRSKHGDVILTFDPAKWARYVEFQKIVGENVDPIVVAHEWRASKQGKPQAEGLTVSKALERYFTLRDEEKSWGDDAKRHADKHLNKRFAAKFGSWRLNDVGTDDVREWLRDLKDDKGGVIGSHGIKDHRKNVKTFFDYCLRERWGAVENPVERIKPPKTDDGDPVVIPLRDAWDFFCANRDERVIGRIALEAFAGIRYTTAGAITKDAINFDGRGIRMAARIHKSGKKDGRTRYRQGHPSNLWDWLKHTPEKTWKMTPLNYREAKRYASIRADLRPIENASEEDAAKIEGLRNIWRHSFISYHLARFRTPALTQYLAQHQSPKTTEEYEGMADHDDAARYFMITPDTVRLTWKMFLALPVEPVAALDSMALAGRLAG
ncbi:tyrosine-type recombinase/integrase [Geminisphaera colitermitum]|uniref:tyrosine-type recombinase/integrase n=1 Tax=Geminisphaera colitermitum TaxID=1148786 RepID=UPI000158CFDC|nr:site-specific integrase [Geminisphaera colitermitum]